MRFNSDYYSDELLVLASFQVYKMLTSNLPSFFNYYNIKHYL